MKSRRQSDTEYKRFNIPGATSEEISELPGNYIAKMLYG